MRLFCMCTIAFILIPCSLPCEKIIQFDLETAVYTGLKNNRELIFKGKENITAEKYLKLRYRDYLPEVKFTYTDSASVAYYNPDSHIKKLNFSLTQKIYDRGKRRASINLGQKQLNLEKLKTEDSKDEFVFQIISSFKDILKLEMEAAILDSTYLNTSRQLEIGLKEKELGEITSLSYLEMEIANRNIALLLERKNNEKEKLIFEFSRLLTLDPDLRPEITGKINTSYCGFITDDYSFFVKASGERSTAYAEKLLAGETADQNYAAAMKENIPDIKADCGFSISGEQFPLTTPGFDMSVTFSFSKPGIPSSVTAGISRDDSERSRIITAETAPFSDIGNIYSGETAKLAMERTARAIEEFKINNEFTVKEILLDIDSIKRELGLLRKKLSVYEKKRAIEELQLELGEIKRIDYVETTIDLSKEKINLVNTVASLYQKEISLLRLCGIKNILKTGSNIILKNKSREEI